jgi:hypothetical protein
MRSTFRDRNTLFVVLAAGTAVLMLSGVGGYLLLSGDAPPVDAPAPEAGSSAASVAEPSAGLAASPTGPTRRTTTPPTRTPTTTKAQGSVLIRWIRKFTPAGGGGDWLEGAYAAFINRDCNGALSSARDPGSEEHKAVPEPYRTLYEGAAAACLAVLDGRKELWPVALDNLPRVDTTDLGCWHLEVYTVYQALVEAGRANQRTTVAGDSAAASDCPELLGLDPDHGSRNGGYSVAVIGRNFPPTLELRWDGPDVIVTARRVSDTQMTVVVPTDRTEDSAQVRIEGAPRVRGPFQTTFHYDD